ncbi:hypothetical protein [Psychrosphaera algicola]|uniref:Uncharacterized protein n=1 Tax=Psychrosphaera algicola TaxID=3023714 RepID=A0ABT5FG80_9GAMM|nr:hypothetical protein [Psychrosphaera sp. G1-22]MDC2889656.1 hypothetical protein [Psychrosphaera sp. G1-22]
MKNEDVSVLPDVNRTPSSAVMSKLDVFAGSAAVAIFENNADATAPSTK